MQYEGKCGMGEAFTASCKQLEDELRVRAGKCILLWLL